MPGRQAIEKVTVPDGACGTLHEKVTEPPEGMGYSPMVGPEDPWATNSSDDVKRGRLELGVAAVGDVGAEMDTS